MNIKSIRRTALILAIGYTFLSIYILFSLYNFEGLKFLKDLYYFAFPGFTLVTVGIALIYKENIYFKWAYSSSLLLDIVLVTYFVLLKVLINSGDEALMDRLSLLCSIITMTANACIALTNGLIANGYKTIYIKENNKKMVNYCTVIEFSVTGLLLMSSILGFTKFTPGIATKIGIGITLAVDFLVQAGYATFMYVNLHTLKKLIK